MKTINYSLFWDKLRDDITPVGTRFTTIRTRYDYSHTPVWDKANYYQSGNQYQQLINKQPAFNSLLIGVELKRGDTIQDWILLKDVTYQGKPNMEWYDKVKGYKDAMLLWFKKTSKNEIPVQ